MDFGFTEEQEKFKKNVHDFYVHELPPEDLESRIYPVNEEVNAFLNQLQKKAGEKGYLVADCPEEYGGPGLTAIEDGICTEEAGYWRIIWPNHLGLRICVPALLTFGTEAQKNRFIPAQVQGEEVWFEVFTEPDAGSDEANVKLRAIPDGDDFILNGQKIFLSGGHKPDYLYTLVRTADTTPKYRGLSLFLVPADTTGITYRPLPTMSAGAQNEIFFDDVRVSREYLLGELNRGFYHAMASFEFERTGAARAAILSRDLEEFVQFCKEERRNGKLLIEEPKIRETLAQMAVEVEVLRLIGWQTQWWLSKREQLGPKPYDLTGFFAKIFNTKHAEAMMVILGMYGQLQQGSKWAKLAGRIERRWQWTRSLHAEGTFEIQKVVLAQRGLGLPRPQRTVTQAKEKE